MLIRILISWTLISVFVLICHNIYKMFNNPDKLYIGDVILGVIEIPAIILAYCMEGIEYLFRKELF